VTFCPAQLNPEWFCSGFSGQGSAGVWSTPACRSGGRCSLLRWQGSFFRSATTKGHCRKKLYERNAAPSERAQQLCSPLRDAVSHGRALPARKGPVCSQKCNTGSREDRALSHRQTPVPGPAFVPRSERVVKNETGLFMPNYLVFAWGRKRRRRSRNTFLSSLGASSVQAVRGTPLHQPPEKPSSG